MLYPKRPALALAFVIASSLASTPVQAASPTTTAPTGSVVGHVMVCEDPNAGGDHPEAGVVVAALGTSETTMTDNTGAFTLSGIPVQSSADIAVIHADGSTGPDRAGVPIWGGQTLDIGDLMVGATIFGCGPDDS